MRCWLIGVALMACVVPASLEATTVLLIGRAGEFVLAADSMEILVPAMERSLASCKLLSNGRTIVATVGPTGDGAQWRPAYQALRALETASSIHDAAREISIAVSRPLSDVLNAYARKVADRELLYGPQPWLTDFGLDMLLLGSDEQGAVAVQLRWDVEVRKGLLSLTPAQMTVYPREPRVHRPPKRGEEPTVFTLGQREALDRELQTHGVGTLTLDRVDALMALQASAKPEMVGAPFDVVTTAGGKLRWLRRKANCTNQ